MTRPRDLNENPGYDTDSTVGFDSEGYVLMPGADSGETVQKHDGSASAVVGVNHMSTYNYDETVVQTGERNVPVIQDGYVNVLVGTDDVDFELGEDVEVDNTAAGKVVPSGTTNASGEKVGSAVQRLQGAQTDDLLRIKLTEV